MLHHFELGLELTVDSLYGLSLLHETCGGGQDCQLFLLNLERELLTDLLQLLLKVDIIPSRFLRLVRQQGELLAQKSDFLLLRQMLCDNVERFLRPGNLKRFPKRLALVLLLSLSFDHLKGTFLEHVQRCCHSFRSELRATLGYRK